MKYNIIVIITLSQLYLHRAPCILFESYFIKQTVFKIKYCFVKNVMPYIKYCFFYHACKYT